MKNRRNYYRLLHVQPEGPPGVIKASYRSLMAKLKVHPDLGGDHDAVVLINEAYAALANPDTRRGYDETQKKRRPAPPTESARAAPLPVRNQPRSPLVRSVRAPWRRCAAAGNARVP